VPSKNFLGQVWRFPADSTRPLAHLTNKPDAMQAMLKMKKLDIAELERAANA
jgi:predicted 3-demethylubiquinone-9 3-methyltransferase (glyoxalase superfamily)